MMWMVRDKQMTNASSGTRTRDIHSSSVVAQWDSHAHFKSLDLKMAGKNFSLCVCVVLVHPCLVQTHAQKCKNWKILQFFFYRCSRWRWGSSPAFLSHSNTFASLVWISRESAFYVFITGARDVFKVKSPDEVFDTLERLLWDHANKVWNVEAASNFCSMRFGIEIS